MIGAAPRSSAAAIRAKDGAVLPWRVDGNGAVNAPAGDDERVFLGGDFGVLNGASRLHLAAANPDTGELLPWIADLALPVSFRPPQMSFSCTEAVSTWEACSEEWRAWAVSIWPPSIPRQEPCCLRRSDRFHGFEWPLFEYVDALAASGQTLGSEVAFPLLGTRSVRISERWMPGPGRCNPEPAPQHDRRCPRGGGRHGFAGGAFGSVGTLERHNLAALDVATGRATEIGTRNGQRSQRARRGE